MANPGNMGKFIIENSYLGEPGMALGLPVSETGVPGHDRDLTRIGRVILQVCRIFATIVGLKLQLQL